MRALVWPLLAVVLALPEGARAAQPGEGQTEEEEVAPLEITPPAVPPPEEVEPPDEHDLPSTLVAAKAGVKALPFAESCPFTGAACEPGEAAMAVGLHAFGRIYDFGVGAGFNWAAGLKTSEAAGAPILEREHSRSYLLLDGIFRYYLPELGGLTWWVGTSIGAVVINDSWNTLSDREPYRDSDLIGPETLSLATEGFAAGLEIGGHWKFYDIWFVGTNIRYSNWVLPAEREQTPLGDLASLAGRVDVIDAGLLLGFELFL